MLSGMKNSRITKNSFLLFLPFLFFYFIYALIFYSNNNIGDESRFIFFAQNLVHGFYSPPYPHIVLTSGPGYPIILMPFIVLHLPKVYMVLINPVLHYFSIILLFKSLQKIVSFRKTIIFSFFWACYCVAYQNMNRVAYESFTIFLISLLIFFLIKAFDPSISIKTKKYIYLAGFTIGYIALTKVIFCYVLVLMFFGTFFLWIRNRNVINYRRTILMILIAFIIIVPYLIYTYNFTGRVFYLGNASDNLYWMSTPYEGEFGDWKGQLSTENTDNFNYNIPGAGDTLKAHHQKDYDEIYKLKGLEQDDALKKIAFNNIKSYPLKYAQNIFYNIGRIIFDYPFSYAIQQPKHLFVFIFNGIILTLTFLCLLPTFMKWQKVIFSIKFMLFFVLLYLAASSLISSETRMLATVVPILLFWIAFIVQKTIKIIGSDKNC